MSTVYNNGLDVMWDWTGGTYEFLLVNDTGGYVVDKDDQFVDAITTAANEIIGAGYSRQAATTPTRTVDLALDRITYDCDDLAFGAIAAGENVTAVVLYLFVTNDADSVLIAYYPLGSVATTGLAFPVNINANGAIYTDQGA